MTGVEIYLPWLVFGGAAAVGIAGFAWSRRQEERRRLALAALAPRLGLKFKESAPGLSAEDYRSLHLFAKGRDRTYRNILSGKPEGTHGLIICDYAYTTGDRNSTKIHRQTVALLSTAKGRLPRFELRPENAFHRLGSLFGYQDIDFPDSPGFSKRYLLRGTDEAAVRALFGLNLRQYFETHPDWCIDGRGRWLAAYRQERLVKPEDYPAFLDEAKLLLWALPRAT
ncbi:MAG: hypothetical protein PHU21_09800 [Elusimicrobia bacterium]|jgi:hypothetical protein|nr:hypothetical protein [Elusimicrobiota bacterium]